MTAMARRHGESAAAFLPRFCTRQGEKERVLRRTCGCTHHARAAFRRADLNEFSHRQIGWTNTRTFSAIDAGFGIATNLHPTED